MLPTLVLERLAGLGLQQHCQLLVGDLAAPVVIDAVHLVLGRPISDRHHVDDPTATDDVEDGHLLGELDRVVQRQEHDRDRDRHGRRASGHGAGERQRCRQVAVVRHVVLAQTTADRQPRDSPQDAISSAAV